MKTFNNVGRGIALATSTLALGSALAVSSNISSAQAAVIGTFNGTGTALIGNLTEASPVTDTISFTGPFSLDPTNSGIFAGLGIVSINTINVDTPTFIANVPGIGSLTSYVANGVGTPLINFTGGYSFVATEPFAALRTFNPAAPGGTNVGYSFDLVGQLFNGAGEFVTSGLLTANEINNPDPERGSFSLSLTAIEAERVPEPTTTVGLAALGLGAFFTNNLAKKKKAKVNA
ncbi:PEP-CTERM sorting domain-containing protein [Anabaena subtropica]|uniref:PEP-CTERM sorting domain-containing protein n=1 Tax=Anabaena subtropica FACHB-260 TaxID=2692884 RepID=A0ABR8CW99_9NOST|nr:PEP-CTERM sorting domain-containing protein [Anabaena subtropica]MBD2346512.1 PEP-CTERM sorting domain-containing protein [Anabaena subtropica FACHB-260]